MFKKEFFILFFMSKINGNLFGSAILLFAGLLTYDGCVRKQQPSHQSLIGHLQVGTNTLDVVKKDGLLDDDYFFLSEGKKVFDTQWDDCIYFDFGGYKIYHSKGNGPYGLVELPKAQRVELSKLEK